MIKCYCGKTVSKPCQMKSASGGIFPTLAKQIIENGGIVWGASFDGINVVHSYVNNAEDIVKLQRSKYVQSDNSMVFDRILKQLSNGNTVLYSGTPCQVNGLFQFLINKKQDVSNLILIEIVCHGVPSPMIWTDFVTQLSEEYDKDVLDITNIQFKYKDEKKYLWSHPGFLIEWGDKQYIDYGNHTWYENGFLGNLFVRPSCHNCRFKQFKTHADIILGDFWGCAEVRPNSFDDNGVSIIFALTEKGKDLIKLCSTELIIEKIDIRTATKYNARIISSTPPSPKRKFFWEEYNKLKPNGISGREINCLIDNCMKETFVQKCKRKSKSGIKKILGMKMNN